MIPKVWFLEVLSSGFKFLCTHMSKSFYNEQPVSLKTKYYGDQYHTPL